MVSIIIPNFNGVQHLEGCLLSLNEQTFRDFKIVIVDNGSSDGSIEFLEKEFPEVILIKLNHNTGFSKAVNTGIEYSVTRLKPDFVILLNNDIECEPDFVEMLLEGFVADSIGAVGCKMMNYYDRKVIDDTGNFLNYYGFPYTRGSGEFDTGQYDTPGYIFGVCAGAAAYRMSALDEVGLFDEDFFAYFEDVDLSLRMQLSGFNNYYTNRAVCYHKRGATMKSYPVFHSFLCERNLFYLRFKNFPFVMLLVLSPLFLLATLKRIVVFLIIGKAGNSMSSVKGYLEALSNIRSIYKKRKIIRKMNVLSIRRFFDVLKLWKPD